MNLIPFTIVWLSFVFLTPTLAQNNTNDSTSITIKVMTFNILHGATTKGDFDLDAIAKVINTVNPDLVALQEVDFKTQRARHYDLATEIGYRTKMAPLFGRAMYYDGGEYGEAILSRFSIVRSRNISLPHHPQHEPRTALEILVELPNGDSIAFIGTHLDHLKDDADRLMQVEKINHVFSKNVYPSILAGDLNAVPESKPIQLLEQIWKPTYHPTKIEPTYPSGDPKKKIDYIMFYPKHAFEVVRSQVINDPIASDHCAYMVELKLK